MTTDIVDVCNINNTIIDFDKVNDILKKQRELAKEYILQNI